MQSRKSGRRNWESTRRWRRENSVKTVLL